MKRILIFDLDGTLFDTTLSMQQCGNYALEKIGLPPLPPSCYAAASGGNVSEFVSSVLAFAGAEGSDYFDAFWKYYLERDKAPSDCEPLPYEGMVTTLELARQKGVTLAVLSNKNHDACVRIVESCFGKNRFHTVQGACDGIKPKPSPEGILRILEQGGFSREDCLYVGDTQFDIRAGKNAAVETVAVLWGYRTRQDLALEEPDHFISHPSQLLALL